MSSRAARLKVRLSNTHRNLYTAYMVYGCLSVTLGLNFLLLHPTFNPLNIPKGLMGIIFLALGLGQLVLLNWSHDLRLLRGVMAAEVAVMFFWGCALTLAFFRLHQTSLQLPLTYFGLAALGIPLLIEPFVNPASGNGKGTP